MSPALIFWGVMLPCGSADHWPECGFPAKFYGQNFVALGCAMGLPPAGPSTYTGVIATNSFTCSQSGTVSLVHSTSSTDLVETVGAIHAEGVNTAESLLINCGQGPPPAPTQIQPGEQPTGEPDGGATPGPSPTRLPPTEEARATSTAEAEATATALARPTGTRPTGGPGGEDDDGGIGGAGIAIIVIVVVVGAGAAGGFGWLYLRRRQGQGS